MSDENTPGKTDENAVKTSTDATTSDKSMSDRVEVVVVEGRAMRAGRRNVLDFVELRVSLAYLHLLNI